VCASNQHLGKDSQLLVMLDYVCIVMYGLLCLCVQCPTWAIDISVTIGLYI
jgi:hypothetical protein